MPKVIPEYKYEAKKRILDVATRIILKTGYQNLKMEDVSKEAGISRPTLYLYYKNREELILAILSNIIADVIRTAEESLNISEKGTDGGFFEFVNKTYPDHFKILIELTAIVQPNEFRIITTIGKFHSLLVDQISQYIESKCPECAQNGKDPIIIAYTLFSLFIGLQTQIKLGMNIEQAREIWNNGVCSIENCL